MSNVLTGRGVAANVTLAAWLLADAVRAFIVVPIDALDVVEVIGALALISAAMFVLLRPAPVAQDLRASTIAIALGAALVPIAFQWLPAATTRGGSLFVFLESLAIAVLTLSILYLGRRFSLCRSIARWSRPDPMRSSAIRCMDLTCCLMVLWHLRAQVGCQAHCGLWKPPCSP